MSRIGREPVARIGYLMVMRRFLLLLILTVAGPLASTPMLAEALEGPCAEYEGDAVSVRGTITLETFPGPPNFVNLYRGDEAITEFVLTLDEPLCVNAQPEREQGPLPALSAVSQIQAKMPADAPIEAFLLGRLGEKVWLHGKLLPPTNRYHYLPVLLKAIRMTPGNFARPVAPQVPVVAPLNIPSQRDQR